MLVRVVKSTKGIDLRVGSVVELDADIAGPLIASGIVVPEALARRKESAVRYEREDAMLPRAKGNGKCVLQ